LEGAAGLVDDYLQTQYRRITLGDLRMRREENAVHQTRVAVRRTRSTLRVFASFFDQDHASHLDHELAWYAEALGRVRDLDISRRRVENDLGAETDGLVDQHSAHQLLRLLETDRQQAWEEALAILAGRRYGALLRELDQWRVAAPWTVEPEPDVMRLLKKAKKKSDKRLERATSDPDAPDSPFHRARKAAKRTRYAAELVRPAVGKAAKRLAKEHEMRQDALGQLQDHVMIVAVLRDLADRQATTSKIAFVCGVLAQDHVRAKARVRSRLT
jgi:CHAD domain-containing protein